MVAFLKRMPQGIPGDITRQSQSTIEPGVLNSALPFASFGIPGKIASGKFVPLAGAETADEIYGILVRPFPITGNSGSDPLGTATPPIRGACDVLRRGYIAVKNCAGVPALNGLVYVRIADAQAGRPIGCIEAAADGAETIVLTGARFMSAADADGNVEIAYNI